MDTMLHIDHVKLAFLGETLFVEAVLREQQGPELIC